MNEMVCNFVKKLTSNIEMQCKAHKECTDETCPHSKLHKKNVGCDFYCHFSDFQLMCKPTSKGCKKITDNIKLFIEREYNKPR